MHARVADFLNPLVVAAAACEKTTSTLTLWAELVAVVGSATSLGQEEWRLVDLLAAMTVCSQAYSQVEATGE